MTNEWNEPQTQGGDDGGFETVEAPSPEETDAGKRPTNTQRIEALESMSEAQRTINSDIERRLTALEDAFTEGDDAGGVSQRYTLEERIARLEKQVPNPGPASR